MPGSTAARLRPCVSRRREEYLWQLCVQSGLDHLSGLTRTMHPFDRLVAKCKITCRSALATVHALIEYWV